MRARRGALVRRVVRRVGWTVAVLALGACDPAPAPSTPSDVQPRAADDTKPVRTRGKVLGGESVDRIVRWPDASTRDDELRALLPEQARAVVDAAPVPILAPSDGELLASTVVTNGAHWSAWSAHADGLYVSFHASRRAKVYPHVEPAKGNADVRGVDGWLTHNEGVWVASWIEHGVAYDLELECAQLQADACQSTDAVAALAESLTFIGGRGR